jgi:GNAT superfamily N-acetyltransferase
MQLEAPGRHPELVAQVEAIFWQTAARTFPPGPGATPSVSAGSVATCEGGSDVVLLALVGGDYGGRYLVGALEIPAEQPASPTSAISAPTSPILTPRFPAHLHVNLAADFRSQGIGAQLIEAFAGHAKRAGAPGVHAVTGKGMRNVRFYTRCGFVERATAQWNGREVVFLGREL